jgi:surface polysaccharide O-acyltransferase-like enzyme
MGVSALGNNTYLHYVHSFRGFAILNIVAIHAFANAQFYLTAGNLDTKAPIYAFSEMLFHDATIYFALISGLLFSAILRPRGYRRFFQSKLSNVLAPYVFCTAVFSAVVFEMDGSGILSIQESLSNYMKSLPNNLILGQAQFTFWYIPVLLALFLLTPLFDKAATAKSNMFVVFLLIALLPLVVSRPQFVPDVSQVSLAAVIYFAGAYTIGIFAGYRLQDSHAFVERYKFVFVALAISASAAIVVLQFNGIDRFGSFSVLETLYYIQKLSIAAIVLYWLYGKGTSQPKWLTHFAQSAFSIYFLHAFYMDLVAHWVFPFSVSQQFLPWSMYTMVLVYFVTSLALSLSTVHVFRMIFRKRSRMLLGS